MASSNKLDRNASTQGRCQRNWQRVTKLGVFDFASTLTTKGDLLTRSTTAFTRVGVGTNGFMLVADSAQTAGFKWIGAGDSSLTLATTGPIVATNGVTFAKFQQITTDRLLGRDTAATGNVEEISVGGGIEFTGGPGIQTSAFTGDATKAAGGTALTLATVNANVGTFNNITINAKGLATAGSNVAYLTGNQTITLSGDVTGSGTTTITTTIANDAVTFAKFQNITDARLLGRSAGSSGDMMEITVGTGLDLTAGVLSNVGAGSGTVTDVSVVTANGISGSVATSTTTPAITLTLGNITPTTVNALTLASQAVGFTIAGGTTSKTLTVPLDASVSGTNTGDQTITLTGDVTGTGTGSFATTLATVNANVGTFNTLTVNAKGLVTAASNTSYSTTTVATDTIWDAKGDIVGGTGSNTAARLALGADDLTNPMVLIAATAETTGLDWDYREKLINFITANSTAINTTSAETSFDNAGLTLPADYFVTAKTIRFRAGGLYSTTGTPTLTLRFKIGGVTFVSSGAITTPSGASNQAWIFEGEIGCHSPGASASFRGIGQALIATGGSVPIRSGAPSVDTTGTLLTDLTAQWSASSLSNTITLEYYTLEALN